MIISMTSPFKMFFSSHFPNLSAPEWENKLSEPYFNAIVCSTRLSSLSVHIKTGGWRGRKISFTYSHQASWPHHRSKLVPLLRNWCDMLRPLQFFFTADFSFLLLRVRPRVRACACATVPSRIPTFRTIPVGQTRESGVARWEKYGCQCKRSFGACLPSTCLRLLPYTYRYQVIHPFPLINC